MQNIQIFWAGSRLDYYPNKDNSLPLSFNKKIDDWLNFFGNFGTTGAEFADTLEIPATKRNSLILFGSDNPNSYNLIAHVQSDLLTINVGYFMLFNGRAELINVTFKNSVPTSFFLRVQGSSADLWGQLEGKNLTDIDMGIAPSSDDDILATHTAVSNTNNPLIWTLVNYGGRMLTPNYPQVTLWDYDNSLRPAVRTWWAIDKIFSQFGYTVIGEFFNSQAFRNAHHPYTNGDDWLRADNWVDFFCNAAVSTSGGGNVVADGDVIDYSDDTSAGRTDPQGINSGFFAPYNSATMLAMAGAWFEFEFFFQKTTSDDVLYQIELSDNTFGGVEVIAQIQSNTAEGQSVYRTEPIWFSNAVQSNRWVLKVRVINQVNVGASTTFSTSTYYAARMTNRFNLGGGALQISSCFAADPVKTFLSGVAHKFGLVYNVDNIGRTVTLEPRFVRDLGQTTPSHNTDFTKTYYRLGENSRLLETDQNSLTIANNKPFGDFLDIFVRRDTDDPIYKLYLESWGAAYNNDVIPLYSVSVELSDVNKQRKTIENPYFAPTINSKYQFVGDNPYNNNLYMPTIIETKEQIEIPNLDYFNGIKATYKGTPRMLMYFGNLDFTGIGQGTNQWAYQRFDGNPTVVLSYNVPSSFEIYPNHNDYFSVSSAVPFNLTYITYFYSQLGQKVFGLIDRYYSKYLSMVFQDKVINVRARMSLAMYAAENFRTPVWLPIAGQRVKAWIIEVANYNPLESEFADFTLVQDTDLIQQFTEYGTATNQLAPVLLMRNDVVIKQDDGTF